MDPLDTIARARSSGAGGRVVEPRDSIDPWCRRCGLEHGRDTVTRELALEPLGCRPKVLKDTIRRHQCIDCGYVWRHTKRGDKCVTVIIDLTPIRDGAGPARLQGAR